MPQIRRPSQPLLGHTPSASTSALSQEFRAGSSYAPSVYAQSTLAASTIMPGTAMQPVRNTDSVQWQEGHCLHWRPHEDKAVCSICEEKSDEGLFRCSGMCFAQPSKNALLTLAGCLTHAHARCAGEICIVCPSAFRPDQVRASFVRCFASILYTYRRYMVPATGDRKKSGMHYQFKMDEFMKNQPGENVQYLTALQQTQGMSPLIGGCVLC
jgi:hypothetical protein